MNDTESRLKKARLKLMLTTDPKQVFMAHLLLIPDRIDDTIKTACTDGTIIRWNPEFVAGVNDAELYAVLLHELMHVALMHTVIARQIDAAEMETLNIAADLAVNSILQNIGVQLPTSALMPGEGQFAHLKPLLSLEAYLAELRKMPKDELPEPAAGEIEAAGSEAKRNGDSIAAELAGEKIRLMVKQAAAKVPGDAGMKIVAGALNAAVESHANVWQYLKKFRSKITKGGSDWTRLNRRLNAVGILAATNRRRTTGNVVVLLDVSGSIPTEMLEKSLAETIDIFKNIAGEIHIMQHDTEIVAHDIWKQGGKMPAIQRASSGGTCHRQPFAKIDQLKIKVDVIVSFTDLYTRYPEQAPKAPVVWAVCEDRSSEKPPFGVVTKNYL